MLDRLLGPDDFDLLPHLVALAIAYALAFPIEPVTPWVEETGGERFITIPAHLGFPVTQEKLDGLWRG